ncbi:MAG: YggS family pyridoxal phosphate-dependent enzyme [Burkholderiaceae bacterium]
MSLISLGLQQVRARIAQAEAQAQRASGSVTLIAVSKTFPATAVLEAIDAGQRDFGENYVQEGVQKVVEVASLQPSTPLQWHFIGPLQSNKTREVAEHFDWVHSVDRLKIAQRLSEQRPAGLPDLQVCLQVNVSDEGTKSGVDASQIAQLAFEVAQLPRLKLRGLMCIPAPANDGESQRAPFAALRALRDALNAQGLALDVLSMGMSADMEAAIAEGATHVRVGTAIFGVRGKKNV